MVDSVNTDSRTFALVSLAALLVLLRYLKVLPVVRSVLNCTLSIFVGSAGVYLLSGGIPRRLGHSTRRHKPVVRVSVLLINVRHA
jgi:hypothetical protein